MDLPRFFLLTALAVVSYLLLLQWNEDYPSTPPQTQQPGASLTNLPQSTGPNGDTYEPPLQVPADVQNQSADTAVPGQTPDATANSSSGQRNLVNVTTDTLELIIDLNGGDLVYLALPQYLRQMDSVGDPFVLLQEEQGRNYIAQFGLLGRDGVDSTGRAQYSSAASSYSLLEGQDSLSIDLTHTTSAGVVVTKRFSFRRGDYLIDVDIEVANNSPTTFQANVYGLIERDSFPDPSDGGMFTPNLLGFGQTLETDNFEKLQFDDIDDGTENHSIVGGWIAFTQHYFVSAWVPDQSLRNTYQTLRTNTGRYRGGFVSPAFSVEPGQTSVQSSGYYAGPIIQERLSEIATNLDLTISYGALGLLAKPIHWLLTHIYPYVGNYGLAIILLTILVKAVFYKLTETQYKSMAAMRKVMPKMQQLKERYGDDKVKLQKATMELYKKEKINPFGGCLPLLVQMPVFIALYWMLLRSVELRHAPFFLWINDLSAMDPFLILPLLMGASMYLQTSLSPAPADPMQAKVMKFMPIMMTVFFLWFPAGLVLYWLVNSLTGILQQWYITRKIEAA